MHFVTLRADNGGDPSHVEIMQTNCGRSHLALTFALLANIGRGKTLNNADIMTYVQGRSVRREKDETHSSERARAK